MSNMYKAKGYLLTVERDQYPKNPREEFDHAGTMVCWHRRYKLGDKHNFREPSDFVYELGYKLGLYDDDGEDPNTGAVLTAARQAGWVILPLYLLDHSGLCISTGSFNDPWDSGQVGWIYISPENIIKEGWTVEQATQHLKGEVKEYDYYLTGEVYGFKLEKLSGICPCCNQEIVPEEIDSCWGCFGPVKENGMLDEINWPDDEIKATMLAQF